jgi:hypothetical protein
MAKARPEMLFLAILHYKKHGRPTQARVRPEPGPKNEARSCPWDGRGQDFFGLKNPGIFSARPVKRSSINEAIDEDELLNYYNLSLFHKKAGLVSFVKFFERMIIH